jgi:NAD(P)-dependent dehydrogenase (short-subunit alcohol dehydrogenase family)
MSRFSGKVVLVTGSGQGIGRATVKRFVEEGAKVGALDQDASRVGETLASGGGAIEAMTGDVTRREDVRRAVQRCVERFGGLDILVANAGITGVQPMLDIDDASWQRILDVNLTGTFLSIQEAARVMARSGGGAIVVTASTNAFWVEANLAAYNASKGGVVALVRTAALDLAQYRIRVNAVEPGVVRTRLAAFVMEDPVAAADYLKRIPLNRFAEPRDVADAVLFLAVAGGCKQRRHSEVKGLVATAAARGDWLGYAGRSAALLRFLGRRGVQGGFLLAVGHAVSRPPGSRRPRPLQLARLLD